MILSFKHDLLIFCSSKPSYSSQIHLLEGLICTKIHIDLQIYQAHSPSLKKFYFFLFMFIYSSGVCVFHMCAGACRGQQKAWDLELEVLVSCPNECWELKAGPPRVATLLTPELSLQPSITFITEKSSAPNSHFHLHFQTAPLCNDTPCV